MLGDCLERLKELPDGMADSIVTDPPYGLSFMGKKWDYDVPSVEIWAECLRVLKPGGHLLAFAGTRTQHRMCCRIEDAGFEIRDMIAWVYGSGFPKSLNVGKAIDAMQGNERVAVGERHRNVKPFDDEQAGWNANNTTGDFIYTKGTSAFEGWGTALKPALEPITLARKPFSGTVAANVLAHGTGAINIDGCRVEGSHSYTPRLNANRNLNDDGWAKIGQKEKEVTSTGRWPANLIHDGSEEVLDGFPDSNSGNGTRKAKINNSMGFHGGDSSYDDFNYGDKGSAARFFYCAKASKKDRNEGCEELIERRGGSETFDKSNRDGVGEERQPLNKNHHPTVKPTDLMRYLCRLVTPPKGIVLDPFMGSGSTGKAALLEGFDFIGIEREAEYIKIAEARIK